jgi:hypothetical protein
MIKGERCKRNEKDISDNFSGGDLPVRGSLFLADQVVSKPPGC